MTVRSSRCLLLFVALVVAAALFTSYGGRFRPPPVHWLSDRVDFPLLRD
jgi:hypothetical protein